MVSWSELTYFGKGFVIGGVLWLLVLILVTVRGLYLNWNLSKMNPDMFYLFNGDFGLLGVFLVGIIGVIVMGIIGWLYGRVVGEVV